MPTSNSTQSVTYSGGMSGVVISFPSGHSHEFPKGVPVEICSEDAKSLANNPDFAPAPKAANPKPSKEDS